MQSSFPPPSLAAGSRTSSIPKSKRDRTENPGLVEKESPQVLGSFKDSQNASRRFFSLWGRDIDRRETRLEEEGDRKRDGIMDDWMGMLTIWIFLFSFPLASPLSA